MLIETLYQPLRKARLTNQTGSWPTRVATLTMPTTADANTATGQVAFINGWGGARAQNGIKIFPYGTGSDNATFSMRLIGWEYIPSPNTPQQGTWVPGILCEVDCTVSTLTGVTGGTVSASERFVDTITLAGTAGNANISCELLSPADDATIGHVMADLKGCALYELTFDLGTATGANALFKLL